MRDPRKELRLCVERRSGQFHGERQHRRRLLGLTYHPITCVARDRVILYSSLVVRFQSAKDVPGGQISNVRACGVLTGGITELVGEFPVLDVVTQASSTSF